MSQSLYDKIEVTRLQSPAAATTDNTAFVSQIIDMAGFAGCVLIVTYGSIADVDVTFTTLLEEGDNSALTDAAAVADADLLGTEAGANPLFSDDNKTFKLGYKGTKRYIRLTVTPAANSGNIFMAGIAIRERAQSLGYATQKV